MGTNEMNGCVLLAHDVHGWNRETRLDPDQKWMKMLSHEIQSHDWSLMAVWHGHFRQASPPAHDE